MAQNTVASKGLAAPAVEAGYKGVLMLLAGLLAFAMVRHLRPAEGASQPAHRRNLLRVTRGYGPRQVDAAFVSDVSVVHLADGAVRAALPFVVGFFV